MNISANTTAHPRTRTRRGLKIGAGAVLAAGLVLAAPLAASAHVSVTPDTTAAGSFPALTFAFSHGCEQSPTTSLTIDVPEGVTYLAPQIEPGWSIERVGAESGIPTQVIYTADAPIESGLRATVTLQVGFAEDMAGESVAFPVVQDCVEGSTNWSEIAEEGQDSHELDSPAPTVVVTATEDDEHGEMSDHSEHDAATAEPGAASSALPIVLGASSLALGAAALVIAIVAMRRTRRS